MPEYDLYPDALSVAELGLEAYAQGMAKPAYEAIPNYVRNQVAHVKK